MRPDENRIEGDKKKRLKRLIRSSSEEIYLTTVPEREQMDEEAEEKQGKTEGWHSFKTS